MKKKMYLFGYFGVVLATVALQSCNDDLIVPNSGGWCGNEVDTVWVEDSTANDVGSNPNDSTDWNPYDSTGNNDGGSGTPNDSTWYDSINFGG
jgi:hypothetical protein